MAKLVSKTYGEALFELAVEENKTDAFLEEVAGIKKILEQNPEFDKLMTHPGIPKQEKTALVEKVFQANIMAELKGFLNMVIMKERYKELPDIFQYFIDRVMEEKKIGIAEVTTAVPMDVVQREQVRRRLLETTGYLTMEMRYLVDPGIIGGMIIRIKDRVVDSSIRTRLRDLTKQLLQIQLG